MKRFHDMKIATKLIICFIIVALIAGVVGGIGIINLKLIENADTLLYEENMLGQDYAGNANVYYERIRLSTLEMIAFDNYDEITASIGNIENYSAKVDEFLKKYEDGIISQIDRQMFNELKSQWDKYNSIVQDAVELTKSGQNGQVKNLILGEMDKEGDSLQRAFDKLLAYNSDTAKSRSDSNTRLADATIAIMVIVIIVGVVISIALGLFVSRTISKPIGLMVEVANKLAIGDIDVDVKASAKDEIGTLMKAFGQVVQGIREQAFVAERLADGDLTIKVKARSDKDLLGRKLIELVEKNNEVLRNINSSAEQVAVGAKQVSDSSVALSQGAAEQASSIEELTASLEEISSQTELNAQNADQANQLAEAAKSFAVQGNIQMQEMLKAMEEINESSANISKIIKVIDDIAFQTNILSLNAAVEAARAGQHGKGFAVVAEEVRNLAARSADAAKETTAMIEGSIKKAEAGTRIAKETAEALNKIVDGIEKAADLVEDIAGASKEQAAGIAQINQGIMQVSEVVQANSATSEESAAASEELSSQAELLKEMVGKFKLKKISYSRSKVDEISPEILKMLEEMAKKRKMDASLMEVAEADSKADVDADADTEAEAAAAKPVIEISDKEFGKY